MKNKKIILIILIALIAIIWIGLAIFIPKMNENKDNDSDSNSNAAELILFYWKTCPHCKAEEWYLDTLKETYNFKVVWYEVYYSKANREIMKEENRSNKFDSEFSKMIKEYGEITREIDNLEREIGRLTIIGLGQL